MGDFDDTKHTDFTEEAEPVTSQASVGSGFTQANGPSEMNALLRSLLEEASFGSGSYKEAASGTLRDFVDSVQEYLKKDSAVKGISNKIISVDSSTISNYGIAALVTKVEGDPRHTDVFYYVIRPATSLVTVGQLEQALNTRHTWPEDVLQNQDVLQFLLNKTAKKLGIDPFGVQISGGLIVPDFSVLTRADEAARIGYYCNINNALDRNPEYKQYAHTDIVSLVQLKPTIRRTPIKLNGVPDALDLTPATWSIEVLTDRSTNIVSSKKTETQVWGYTDVMPSYGLYLNGAIRFGFFPTYVITDMRHDTKIPVLERSLFAVASCARAAFGEWHRESLVPHGSEEFNNIWALRRYVDPDNEYMSGKIPSIDPPENEMMRNYEMDKLITPNVMSIVMDVRTGDQKHWFLDTFVGLASRDPEVRTSAEQEVFAAADILTGGIFGRMWNSLPNRPASIADSVTIACGYVHMRNGAKLDMRTITNLTYANILAADIHEGYTVDQIRDKILRWATYANADLRNDRINLKNWINMVYEADPELEITGWCNRISIDMTFIKTLLDAMSECKYYPQFEGEVRAVQAPNSLVTSIMDHSGALSFAPGAMPGMQPGMQPGMVPGMMPGMMPGMHPNMPGQQPFQQPSMYPNNQPPQQPTEPDKK